jgi:hypothetical protein
VNSEFPGFSNVSFVFIFKGDMDDDFLKQWNFQFGNTRGGEGRGGEASTCAVASRWMFNYKSYKPTHIKALNDLLSNLYWTASVVRVPGYRFRGPGSIPALPDFLRSSGSNGVHSASWVQLWSYFEEKVAASV